MPNSAFNVETNLIDRNDLNIYEKMCSVVLARYAGRAEFSNMLNINVIAIRMGCDVANAEKALNSLILKKLVTLEDAGTIEPELLVLEPQKVSSRVIKSESRSEASTSSAKGLEPLAFETLESFDEETETPERREKPKGNRSEGDKLENSETDKPKRTRKTAPKKEKSVSKNSETDEPGRLEEATEKITQNTVRNSVQSPVQNNPRPLVPKQVREGVQDLIDQVFEIIDENINDREARIILSFANNDIEQVREKYKVAKSSQVNDKIEMLINELQKREAPAQTGSQGTKMTQTAKVSPEETVKSLKNKQIDLDNINRMVALKQNSYGKQGQKK